MFLDAQLGEGETELSVTEESLFTHVRHLRRLADARATAAADRVNFVDDREATLMKAAVQALEDVMADQRKILELLDE